MALHSYIGAHVTMSHENRTLLGEVYDYNPATDRLSVRFFNREYWPYFPLACEVKFLEREYDSVEDS